MTTKPSRRIVHKAARSPKTPDGSPLPVELFRMCNRSPYAEWQDEETVLIQDPEAFARERKGGWTSFCRTLNGWGFRFKDKKLFYGIRGVFYKNASEHDIRTKITRMGVKATLMRSEPTKKQKLDTPAPKPWNNISVQITPYESYLSPSMLRTPSSAMSISPTSASLADPEPYLTGLEISCEDNSLGIEEDMFRFIPPDVEFDVKDEMRTHLGF